jgi:hypothetical protein
MRKIFDCNPLSNDARIERIVSGNKDESSAEVAIEQKEHIIDFRTRREQKISGDGCGLPAIAVNPTPFTRSID